MTDRPIVFLDTETNGLHADRRPWEIAWIRREVDGTETERCIQIADVDNTNAELKGLQVGRFHERFQGGPKVASSLLYDVSWTIGPPEPRTLLLEWDTAIEVEKATRDAIIVGVVPNFDTEVLAAMLRRHKLCPSWHYQLVDIEALAAGWLSCNTSYIPDTEEIQEKRHRIRLAHIELEKAKDTGDIHRAVKNLDDARTVLELALEKDVTEFVAPPWRSDDLSRACGVEPPTPDERHTALGDARWVKRWYDHIIGSAA